MSRIGKMPIDLPEGVKVDISGTEVVVSGGKGKLSQRFHRDMNVVLDDGTLRVERPSDSRQHKALHGLTRSLINNMVIGVSEGYTRKLLIEGVGYRAETSDKRLVLNVGYSHPVYIDPPQDIQFATEARGKEIIVTGIDKPLIKKDGCYEVSEKPGLGIELVDEECKKYLREEQYVNKTGYFEPTPEFDEKMTWKQAREKGIITRRAAWRGPWIHLDEEGNLVNRADGR